MQLRKSDLDYRVCGYVQSEKKVSNLTWKMCVYDDDLPWLWNWEYVYVVIYMYVVMIYFCNWKIDMENWIAKSMRVSHANF